MTIGKKGEMGINFSNDMVFPNSWKNKFERDSKIIQAEKAG